MQNRVATVAKEGGSARWGSGSSEVEQRWGAAAWMSNSAGQRQLAQVERLQWRCVWAERRRAAVAKASSCGVGWRGLATARGSGGACLGGQAAELQPEQRWQSGGWSGAA